MNNKKIVLHNAALPTGASRLISLAKNKKAVLYGLVMLLSGVFYFTVQAQQKGSFHHADFSGKWRAKESIAIGGNIVCCYNSGDRMLADTMQIAGQAGFLTIAFSSAFPGTTPVKSQETLTFDGKERELQINHSPKWGKKFTVSWSADGQTMTVSSVVHFMTTTPYQAGVLKQAFVYVTEVWKLGNDGKSISVQVNAKSDLYDGGRSWNTVFYKVH